MFLSLSPWLSSAGSILFLLFTGLDFIKKEHIMARIDVKCLFFIFEYDIGDP